MLQGTPASTRVEGLQEFLACQGSCTMREHKSFPHAEAKRPLPQVPSTGPSEGEP
jgi:hypothetical protein